MNDHRIGLADVVRQFKDDYVAQFGPLMMLSHKKALADIVACMTGVEFIRRFLMHVLPKGFHKLRYYGLWPHSKRHLQPRARLLSSLRAPLRVAECLQIADVAAEANHLSEGKDVAEEGCSPSCPRCGSPRVELLQERRHGPAP